ncbi:hypothetical protein [Methanocaldococcus sp.]
MIYKRFKVRKHNKGIKKYKKKKYYVSRVSREEFEKIEEILDICLAKAMEETKDDELLTYDEIKDLLEYK